MKHASIVFFIVLTCILVGIFYSIKLVTFENIQVTLPVGYFAHNYSDDTLIINADKSSTTRAGNTAYFMLSKCLMSTDGFSNAAELLDKQHSLEGELTIFGAPTTTELIEPRPTINGLIELETPYISRCFNEMFQPGKNLDPDQIYSPHRAFMFINQGVLYEIIYYPSAPNSRLSDQVLKMIRVL